MGKSQRRDRRNPLPAGKRHRPNVIEDADPPDEEPEGPDPLELAGEQLEAERRRLAGTAFSYIDGAHVPGG